MNCVNRCKVSNGKIWQKGPPSVAFLQLIAKNYLYSRYQIKLTHKELHANKMNDFPHNIGRISWMEAIITKTANLNNMTSEVSDDGPTQ